MLFKLILAPAIIFILISSIFFLYRQNNNTNQTSLIVFFGDSITAGQGARLGEDFPSIIGRSLNVPIINAGVSGNTTSDALLRVNKDVISRHPSMVVIELGGNDLLLHENPNETQKNLDQILQKIKPTGAKIVLLGIKFSLFTNKYVTDERNLAKKYGATFVPDILEDIITDPSLKFDDIHPNAKGYQKIAEKLTPIIKNLQ